MMHHKLSHAAGRAVVGGGDPVLNEHDVLILLEYQRFFIISFLSVRPNNINEAVAKFSDITQTW